MKKLLFIFLLFLSFKMISQVNTGGQAGSYYLAGVGFVAAPASIIYDWTQKPGLSTALGFVVGEALTYVVLKTSWDDASLRNKTLMYWGGINGIVFIRAYFDLKSRKFIFVRKPKQVEQYVVPEDYVTPK